MTPQIIPTLDDLLKHPERIADLPPAVALDLYHTLHGLALLLVARAVTPGANGHEAPEDRLLTAKEAAAQLGHKSPDWIYDHADSLPFTVKVGSRGKRFSAVGLAKWIRSRQGR
jgi:predicted DNA-binding transcriptional regulator AlpA